MRGLGSCLAVTVGLLLGILVGGAIGWFVFMITKSDLDPLFAIGYIIGFAGVGGLAGGFLGFWFVASR